MALRVRNVVQRSLHSEWEEHRFLSLLIVVVVYFYAFMDMVEFIDTSTL